MNINTHGTNKEIKGFMPVCIDCDSTNVLVKIEGAPEYGAVGEHRNSL